MASISIERRTSLDRSTALDRVKKLEKELNARANGVFVAWSGSSATVIGPMGVTGSISVKSGLISLYVDLPFPASLVKGIVQSEIEMHLARMLG